MSETSLKPAQAPPPTRWNSTSLLIICLLWLILQFGGLFSPGLLDDVDSIYIQIAREMLARHDFVTPTIDGIRFFDKPPLMYWLAAASMRLFGIYDWCARIPLALGTLALFLATYALGNRLFRPTSPPNHPDRGGFYAALAMATGIGPYLYTRFYIPDILIALWMTLAVHLTLIALDRLRSGQSALLPCLAFAAALAANLLTKGLIGLVFPLAFVFLYLALTGQLRLLKKLHLLPSSALFLTLALPWHILAALRNPPIAMPPGIGLPAKAGWAWFYLYNEHVARFLSRRIPHDYGQTPIWLFWLFALLWMMPWTVFLPHAIRAGVSMLRTSGLRAPESQPPVVLFLWTLIVLGFFTLSARQEYYSLPALPAFALLAAGLLAQAESHQHSHAPTAALRWSLYLLVPIATLTAAVTAFFALTAPTPPPGSDLSSLLASHPDLYNLSLGHLFDLTGAAMGLFRLPLAAVALGMIAIGPVAWLIRRKGQAYLANLTLAAGMTLILLAAHEGLVRFYPILGSKDLALKIATTRRDGDQIMIDGWLTWGSTLLFYTGQPVSLVNGRIYGPWYGSFWPDCPTVFEDDASLRKAWVGSRRIFLLTFDSNRASDLMRFGPVYTLWSSGGKTVISNRNTPL